MIHVVGYHGLGDNVYQRPVIKALVERDSGCFLQTSWPWLYRDMPSVRFIKPNVNLRTQKAHYNSLPESTWVPEPSKFYERVRIKYGPLDFMKGMTPVDSFADKLGVDPVPASLDVGLFDTSHALRDLLVQLGGRPFGIVRPATLRKEWSCPSRNPNPGVIQQLVSARDDLTWISVAWLKEREEWLVGDAIQGVSFSRDHGELSPIDIAVLVSLAEVVVAAPGYMIPLCQALGLGQRAVIVYGGHVPPRLLEDERLGPPLNNVAPDPFCECFQNVHNCDKRIRPEQIKEALERIPS